jgi:hypothetical protein
VVVLANPNKWVSTLGKLGGALILVLVGFLQLRVLTRGTKCLKFRYVCNDIGCFRRQLAQYKSTIISVGSRVAIQEI